MKNVGWISEHEKCMNHQNVNNVELTSQITDLWEKSHNDLCSYCTQCMNSPCYSNMLCTTGLKKKRSLLMQSVLSCQVPLAIIQHIFVKSTVVAPKNWLSTAIFQGKAEMSLYKNNEKQKFNFHKNQNFLMCSALSCWLLWQIRIMRGFHDLVVSIMTVFHDLLVSIMIKWSKILQSCSITELKLVLVEIMINR